MTILSWVGALLEVETPNEQHPIHVLFVHANSDLYGASRSMARLVGELSGGPFRFSVVLPDDGPLVDLLRQENASVYIMRNLSVVRRRIVKTWRLFLFLSNVIPSTVRLWQMIHRLKVDAVHLNTSVTPAAAIAAKLAGVGIIWHIREIYSGELSLLRKLYHSFILCIADLVVCVSTPVRQQFPPGANKVQVHHNGLEIGCFDAIVPDDDAIRQRFNIPKKATVVAMFSRIHPWKGQDLFVETAALLRKRLANTYFLIVGDVFPGYESVEASIKERITALGMGDRIFLTGFLREPRPLMASVSVVVLPSTQPDPFPGVVIEAMALSRPVVATGIGGPTEQVVHGATGYLVAPDATELSNAIERLVRSPELRASFGRAARQRITDHFSLPELSSNLAVAYQRLAARRTCEEKPSYGEQGQAPATRP